jgi:predicted MFS family arabinose efflux permease
VLCVLYGFAHRLFSQPVAFVVVAVVFVLDAILFITGMARTMYVKASSADQDEVTSTLSTGISVNHLVSIVIALLGGLLWERLGMEVLFGAAGVFALGSAVFALALPTPRLRKTPEGEPAPAPER